MAATDANPLDYLQNRFEEAYSETDRAAKTLARETTQRRLAARILKAIAVFGGIAITAGLHGIWSQVVGILIAVSVGVDYVLSNHKSLIAKTEAQYAYENLLKRVKRRHQRELVDVLDLKSRDESESRAMLQKLVSELMAELHEKQELIEKGLQEKNLEMLRALSLEQHSASVIRDGRE